MPKPPHAASIWPGLTPAGLLRQATRFLIVLWLLLAAGMAVSIGLRFGLGRGFGIGSLLDLDNEAGLGTWVATLLLFGCALLAAANAARSRAEGSGWQRNWWALAGCFALMSLDEVAMVHDRVSAPLQQLLGTSGVLFFAWVIPAVAAGLAFLLFQLRFLTQLGRTGRDLVLAGVVFVSGAVGFEMAQAVIRSSTGGSSPWDVFPLAEELLELAGVMLAGRVLLAHLLTTAPEPPPAIPAQPVPDRTVPAQTEAGYREYVGKFP